MSLVYVFVASKMEAQPILALCTPSGPAGPKTTAVIVDRGENRFAVIITGMGMANAKAKAIAALGLASAGSSGGPPTAQKPDAVLAVGLCGGLTQALPEQRIVAYTECLSAEPNRAPPVYCSPTLTEAIVGTLQRHGITCDRVTGITSTRIATAKSDRLALAKSGATAVDMESYEIISAAGRAGVPAAVLRIASDSVDTAMPDFNPALNAEGGLDGGKALWIAIRSPFGTLRLLAANKHAMERLGPAAKLIFQSNCFSRIGSPLKK
jgi:nucleoside phosphorylase